jgi:hypothetical protein
MRTMTICVALVFAAACAEAHDIYTGLKDHRGKFDCCNETDCRPVHHRVTGAGVEMFIDNEWVRIPNEIIQYRTLHGDTGETHGGHWCGSMYPGFEVTNPDYPEMPPSRFYTRCAILPPRLF